MYKNYNEIQLAKNFYWWKFSRLHVLVDFSSLQVHFYEFYLISLRGISILPPKVSLSNDKRERDQRIK